MSRFIITSLLLLTGCSSPSESPIITEAKKAEKDGQVILNDFMVESYPITYKRGSPSYLERDYEAGANLICDQILYEYSRDICSESKIHWRNPKMKQDKPN